jgi:hypothetical protein
MIAAHCRWQLGRDSYDHKNYGHVLTQTQSGTFANSGPWALVVAPVANERSGWVSAKPEPREKGRFERGTQSSVGIFA